MSYFQSTPDQTELLQEQLELAREETQFLEQQQLIQAQSKPQYCLSKGLLISNTFSSNLNFDLDFRVYRDSSRSDRQDGSRCGSM